MARVTQVDSWKDSRGGLHRSEKEAVIAEIRILTKNNIDWEDAAQIVENRFNIIAVLQQLDGKGSEK